MSTRNIPEAPELGTPCYKMLVPNGVRCRGVPLYVLQTGMMLTDLFQTSTQPLQTSLVVAGVSATLVVLLVIVIVVVIIVIIVVVMRRRNKDYALQQSTEGPAFMNAVYSGMWTM